MNNMMTLTSVFTAFFAIACAGSPTPSSTPTSAAGDSGNSEPAAGSSAGSSALPAGTELSDLEAKRLRQAITEKLPEHQATFTSLCGGSVTIEIDWSSIGKEKEALETLRSNYGAERVVQGFQGVCTDKTGKDAVKAKIKTLKLVNTRDAAKVGISISGGTLTATLSWSAGSPGMNENEIAAAITKQL